MVVFTCNHCGDSLQKPKVAKHYDTTCRRNPINLTCVDCFTDFKLQEYVAHTKCFTEEDRYSAKGTASKILKGELKQNEWVKTVNLIIEQQKNARPGIKNILQGLVKYDNIPRKKVKFLNFAKNAFGFKVNERDVEEVWNILEAHKNSVNKSKQEVQNGDGEIKEQGKTENLGESNADKKSKKKRKKSESEGTVENGTNDGINTEIKDPGTTDNLDTSNQEKKSKKKKKKSESEGTGENGIEQEQKKPENLDESNQDNKSKKKKKSESEGTVENGINEELKPENLDESNQDKKSKKKKKKSEDTIENGIENKQEQEKPGNLDESNQEKKSKKKKSESEETMEIVTNGVETSEDITKKKRKSKEPVTETINGAEESPQKKQKLNETSEENEADLSSKKKKKKKSLPDDETPQKKQKLDETSETNDSKQTDSQNESFSFKEVITEILTKKSKGLSKEALQNKVFKKYEAIMGPIENMEILLKKYNKKLKTLKNISYDSDKYTLSNSE